MMQMLPSFLTEQGVKARLGPELPGGHGKKKNTIVHTLYYLTGGSRTTSHCTWEMGIRVYVEALSDKLDNMHLKRF